MDSGTEFHSYTTLIMWNIWFFILSAPYSHVVSPVKVEIKSAIFPLRTFYNTVWSQNLLCGSYPAVIPRVIFHVFGIINFQIL